MLVVATAASLRSAGAPIPGAPLVESFTADSVGAEGQTLVATEDSNRILYFGRDGLLTFDGARWREHTIAGAYGLRALAFGKDGRLWAGATGEIGWFSRTRGEWTYHSLVDQMPFPRAQLGELWHVFPEGNGAVFVATNYVLRWDGTAFQSCFFPDTRHLLGFDVDGRIMVQHRGTGLHVIGRYGPELILPASIIGESSIFWIAHTPNGWTYVSGGGLFTLEAGTPRALNAETNKLLGELKPTKVVPLGDDRLAVGTMGGGLFVVSLQGTIEAHYDEAAGLGTSAVPLLLDGQGNLWVSSRAKLFRIALAANATLLDRRAGLPSDPIEGIVEGNDRRLYAATSSGLFAFGANGSGFEPVEHAGMGLLNLINTPAGVLAAGYHGVQWQSPRGMDQIFNTERDVFALAPAATPGRYLVADGRNVSELSLDGTSRVIVADLPDPAVGIVEDDRNNVWLQVGYRGVMVAHRGSATAMATADIPGLPRISGPGQVAALGNGGLLVFNTAGAWLKPAGSDTFTPVRDYPHGAVPVCAPAIANGSVVWLVHPLADGRPATVARILIHGTDAVWQPDAVDGLAKVGAPHSIFAQPVGAARTILWIGGTNGIVRHELSGEPAAPAPAAPLLHAFARASSKVPRAPITTALPYSTQRLEFEFAAPESAQHHPLRLETRIDGIDSDWVAASADARRELSAVREGRYTFQVRAVADTGVASQPTVFRFEVLPPWWRTAPALLAGLLALTPLGYGAYRLRVRTLRKRNAELEENVRLRTEELARASAAKTQFVANMSHDIRNPLNGIVGLALALEDSKLDPRQRELVATLRECTTYLSSLVDDVLDFATIEAGKVELRPEGFRPAQLLNSIVTAMRTDTATRGAELALEIDPRLPAHLVGDTGRIQQILVNYVSNALKYAGGRIRLTAGTPPKSPGEIEFAVIDQGPGISAEEQAELFTKFSRLDAARHANIPGTGLGLAACRQLADLMGGAVGVESIPGRGARFSLRLPLVVAAETAPAAPATLPNSTVLLVEDTDYNAWAATAVLAKLGLGCERARNGAEALRMFTEKRYNVVLLDRKLPDMDGLDVARRIRQLETDGPQAVLLAVTAYCTAADRQQCLDAGMDAFVGKPLTPDKLRRVLVAAGRRMLAAATLQLPPDVATVEPAPPPLDLSMLEYLGEDTDAGLAGAVDRFLAALEQTAHDIAEAGAQPDYDRLGSAAHFLRSQAGMVGAATLANVAAELESAALDAAQPRCRELLAQTAAELAGVTAALRRRRSSAPRA